MNPAINGATTMPHAFTDDVKGYAAAGFTAIELWLEKVEKFLEDNSLADAVCLLRDHNLRAVGACFHFGVMLSEGRDRAENLDVLRRKLEICQALEASVLVVPTDFPEREVVREDYDRAAEGLAEAADIAAPYGVSLAVEFIKGAKLVGTLRTALDLVRKAARPNAGILLDTFHLWAGASDIRDIAQFTANELLLVHINDVRLVPVEIAEDRDRVLPGEGVMPVREILQAVARTGYRGFCSVELFDECLWWKEPGEIAKGWPINNFPEFNIRLGRRCNSNRAVRLRTG